MSDTPTPSGGMGSGTGGTGGKSGMGHKNPSSGGQSGSGGSQDQTKDRQSTDKPPAPKERSGK